jgi:hypothetical protein
MKRLESDREFSLEGVDTLLAGFSCSERDALEPKVLRDKLLDGGYSFRRLKPKASNASILTADCSIAVRETRYHALWAAHAVAVSAVCDGGSHWDAIIGNGTIPYRDLKYSSYVGLGEFIPYCDVDVRGNGARVRFEFESLRKAFDEALRESGKPDLILIDGSIHTNDANLDEGAADYEENAGARKAFDGVMGLGKVVGMVEDSHSTDISRRLGCDFTNMLLFDVALEEGEYVVETQDSANICHIKLPGKSLPYLPQGISRPLTVRWEFGYGGFEADLDLLAGIWLLEDDILHPQLYPIRMADHLSRRIKAAGILDEVVGARRLEPKFRELREG